MTPAAKLAAFAVALLAVFTGGIALGTAVGPLDDPPPPPHTVHAP